LLLEHAQPYSGGVDMVDSHFREQVAHLLHDCGAAADYEALFFEMGWHVGLGEGCFPTSDNI
jgi:hypothetical protein